MLDTKGKAMEARREDVIYVVEEFAHEGYDRIFPMAPKAFSSVEAADEYIRERCLPYLEDCLWDYENGEGGLDDPADATFRIAPRPSKTASTRRYPTPQRRDAPCKGNVLKVAARKRMLA